MDHGILIAKNMPPASASGQSTFATIRGGGEEENPLLFANFQVFHNEIPSWSWHGRQGRRCQLPLHFGKEMDVAAKIPEVPCLRPARKKN
jgi:hypothetical protein